MLSVAAHADEDGAEDIALAALAAVATLDSDRSILYPDFILALLGKAARIALEKIMATRPREPYSDIFRSYYFEGRAEGRVEGRTEGRTEGEAHGKATLLLKLLRLRGFTVPEPVQQRVLDCRDGEQLDAWAARVLDARSLADVLDA